MAIWSPRYPLTLVIRVLARSVANRAAANHSTAGTPPPPPESAATTSSVAALMMNGTVSPVTAVRIAPTTMPT